jgi:hypothetical protein
LKCFFHSERIRLKIIFRSVDEISAYVGANSFALGDLSRPPHLLLVKIQGSYYSPCPKPINRTPATLKCGKQKHLGIRTNFTVVLLLYDLFQPQVKKGG